MIIIEIVIVEILRRQIYSDNVRYKSTTIIRKYTYWKLHSIKSVGWDEITRILRIPLFSYNSKKYLVV